MKRYKFQHKIFYAVSALLLLVAFSCQKEYLETPEMQDDALTITSSDTELVLTEVFAQNLLTFVWSTGTNQGTNSAISYKLIITKEGDNAIPLEYDLGKNVFSFSYEWGTLNNILLNTFGAEPGTPQIIQAKITATVATGSVAQQESASTVTVTPYNPVTTQLFIVGTATPSGDDIANAPEMTPSETGIFTYQGQLTPGTFKFPVNRDTCWCQDFYTRDPSDATRMIFNEGGSGDDLQWEITETGEYTIVADVLNLTLSIQFTLTPPFSEIWIVGDASPSGWNIDSPEAFTQSEEDPFIFTYEANLTPGNFKIFAGPLGDWCGEWYRPPINDQDLTSNEVEQNSGCDVDNKWLVTDENKGRYKIILNTRDNVIEFQLVTLYVIGDGGPNGWNIATPEPMIYEDGTYVFNGELGADNPTGEFKISKFKGDWCDGDWINAATPSQSLLNTDYIITHGCDGPDNKWKLGEGDAGTWEIRINLDEETMTITR
ncbi:MAG: SusF/SusE family outer membrane protein [Bacteroidales bacterium]|nr:SusF/SusE family outer membrane protein [Bacteroidales bacterium]